MGNTAQGHTPKTLNSTAKSYKLVSAFPVLSYTCNTICESSQDLHCCSFVHLISITSGIRLKKKKKKKKPFLSLSVAPLQLHSCKTLSSDNITVWLLQTSWRELSGTIRAKELWTMLLLAAQTINYTAENLRSPCFTQSSLLLNSIEKTVNSSVSAWGWAPKKARRVRVNLETAVQVSASGVYLSKTRSLCIQPPSTAFLEPHYSILPTEYEDATAKSQVLQRWSVWLSIVFTFNLGWMEMTDVMDEMMDVSDSLCTVVFLGCVICMSASKDQFRKISAICLVTFCDMIVKAYLKYTDSTHRFNIRSCSHHMLPFCFWL